MLLDFLFMLLSFGKISLTKNGRFFLKSISEADVVIHAPDGPFIGDIYWRKSFIDLDFLHLYRLFIIKFLKRKSLFFYAPSMGPFESNFRNFFRKFIFKKIDLITVRESLSANYLKKQLGINSVITSDSALQNTINKNYLSKYDNLSYSLSRIKNKKTVGLIITDLSWHPIHGRNQELPRKIKNCWLTTVDYLIKKGYQILLIPQWFTEINTNEISFLKEISDSNQKYIFTLPSNIDSFGQQIIISKMFCVLTMRYHPFIWAIKMNTPFVAVSYEYKFEGFLNDAKLTDYLIDVKKLNANKLIDKFNNIEKNYKKIKNKLNNTYFHLKKKSLETNELMMNKLF